MIGPEAGGTVTEAVLLLVVLEDRDQRASDRQTGAVERVHELDLAGPLRPELDVGPAGLKAIVLLQDEISR